MSFRVNFRGGEGVFRGTRLWVLFGDWGGDCFLFVNTSEKSLGGKPQIERCGSEDPPLPEENGR